jgi:hypothetical protein
LNALKLLEQIVDGGAGCQFARSSQPIDSPSGAASGRWVHVLPFTGEPLRPLKTGKGGVDGPSFEFGSLTKLKAVPADRWITEKNLEEGE